MNQSRPKTTDHRDGDVDARLLRDFVADRDAACPKCGYNLRDITGATCPECGCRPIVVLKYSLPNRVPWLLVVMATSAGLALLIVFFQFCPPDALHLKSVPAVVSLCGFVALTIGLIVSLCARRRFMGLPRREQWFIVLLAFAGLIAGAAALSLVLGQA